MLVSASKDAVGPAICIGSVLDSCGHCNRPITASFALLLSGEAYVSFCLSFTFCESNLYARLATLAIVMRFDPVPD